jgi:hypothetical protein
MPRLKSFIVVVTGAVMLLVNSMGVAGLPAGRARMPDDAIDVELGPGHVLRGKLVSNAGVSVRPTRIQFMQADRRVAETLTDADGCFFVKGLPAGMYVVKVAETCSLCRVWAPETAPPAANGGLMLVRESLVVRGQNAAAVWEFYLIALAAAGGVIAYRVSRDAS